MKESSRVIYLRQCKEASWKYPKQVYVVGYFKVF